MALLDTKDTAAGVAASYLARFSGLDPRPAWLRQRRQAAFARFAELGLPSHRHEDWRYTNLSPARRVHLRAPAAAAARRAGAAPARARAARRGLERRGAAPGLRQRPSTRPGLSSPGAAAGVPRGPPRCRCWPTSPTGWPPHLAARRRARPGLRRSSTPPSSRTAPSSTSPPARVVERPICILHLTAGARSARASPIPRTLVRGRAREPGGRRRDLRRLRRRRLLHQRGRPSIVLGDSARVEHYQLQEESRAAFHVATADGAAGGATAASPPTASRSAARSSRNDVHARPRRRGGGVRARRPLRGRTARQHVDNSTIARPRRAALAPAGEIYKGILDGQARGVFTGRILVRQARRRPTPADATRTCCSPTTAAVDTPAAARDLRRRREVHPRRHGRPARRRGALLPALARPRRGGEPRSLLIYAFAADVVERIGSRARCGRCARRWTACLPGGGTVRRRQHDHWQPRTEDRPVAASTSSGCAAISRSCASGPRQAARLPRQRRHHAEAAGGASTP